MANQLKRSSERRRAAQPSHSISGAGGCCPHSGLVASDGRLRVIWGDGASRIVTGRPAR